MFVFVSFVFVMYVVFVVPQEVTASFRNTFRSHRTHDPVQESYEQSMTNVWTDMEKCVFLDRFMQYPKDFHKIATFLRNKSTKDCISFYYLSKQTVPYKKALKEHMMRRKRRGEYHVWDDTVQAALSVGAVVKAGSSEEKPLLFLLPEEEVSYKTRNLHPLRLDLLEEMDVSACASMAVSSSGRPGGVVGRKKEGKNRKRNRESLFVLDSREQKYLRRSVSQDESVASASSSSSSGGKKDGSLFSSHSSAPPPPSSSALSLSHEDGDDVEESVSVVVGEKGMSSTPVSVSVPVSAPASSSSVTNVVRRDGGDKGAGGGSSSSSSSSKKSSKWTLSERKAVLNAFVKHGEC